MPSQQYARAVSCDRSSEGGDKWRRNLTMRFPCSSQPHTLRSLKANQRESSEIVPCTLLNRTYVRACVPAPAAEPARLLPPLTRRSWFDYPLHSPGQVSAASEIRRKQRGRDPPPPTNKSSLTCPCPQQRRRVRPTAPYYARPNPAARPWIGHLVGGRARTLAKACVPSSVDRGCMTARPCALYSVLVSRV